MAGNSSRRGAVRKPGSKKGQVVGSGGQRRKGLQPKGPTPRAEDRPGHPASRRQQRAKPRPGAEQAKPDIIAGRNAVHEALLAELPATALYMLDGLTADDRTRASLSMATAAHLPIKVVTRVELDRVAETAHHQGVALIGAPFDYQSASDLPAARDGSVIVALDHITDPHNLGAIARSAAAFGARALLLPQRRSAGVTAAAWKASAGALARIPVARVGNLATTLRDLQRQGYFVVGLDGAGTTGIGDLSETLAAGPLVLVVGAEGEGLARLTAETCDLVVRIPISAATESLNASVAAGVALYELARRR